MPLDPNAPEAKALKAAICAGDIETLRAILKANPHFARIRIGQLPSGIRTPLHILADYPGHLPHRIQTARLLIEYGADVNAPFEGPLHSETPLHWAASCNDVVLITTLLDAGADIEAPGGVIGGGTPLADARAFLQIDAAHELIRHGASVRLQDAATLGLLDRVRSFYDSDEPSREETNAAFWNACHGGQLATARFLYEKGADVNAMPSWEELTPLEAAQRSEAGDVVDWLEKIRCAAKP
ncbi:ankyrin [Xylariaceae sp. AK1471]|nr:ankyrin [Xylariaceae sp. AK1471]